MWYMPYLRVRRAVIIYAAFVIGLSLIAIALRYAPGVMQVDAAGHARLAAANIDIAMLLAGSAALVGGFATVLGLNLAAENEGHLELAWTKPISREGYALGIFGVDFVAIAACISLTAVCACAIADVYLGHQAVVLGSTDTLIHAVLFCGFPLSVYAWVSALSASLKRNRGSVAGLFWPLMLALAALRLVPIPIVHQIAVVLDTVNPLQIYSTASSAPAPPNWTLLSGWALAALLLAAALVQWRRLEA